MDEVFRRDSSLVDTRDKYFKTPLMVACTHANYDVAKFLLDHKYVFMNTFPLPLFRLFPYDDFPATNASSPPSTPSRYSYAFYFNSADIQAVDNFHWTALHFACHAGLLDLIVMLVERGADLDATTMNGATPLMRAVESSRPDCVQFLIDSGAKMQTENRKGQ